MSKNKKTYSEILPPIIVGIGYRDLYDDYDSVEINDILDGIPTAVIINFIAENLDKVLYAFSDTHTQRQLIRDFCQNVTKETDTLIDLSYRLNNGELQLEALLYDYLLKNKTRFVPFSNYVEDNYKRKQRGQILEDEIKYLFDDLVA